MNGSRHVMALVAAVGLVVLTAGGLWAAQPDVPEVTGTVWMKSTQQEKLAFLVGAGSAVAIENHVDSKSGAPSKFVTGWIDAFGDETWSDVAIRVDKYYSAHPDMNERLVMDVLWKEMIMPDLKSKEANP
jgi:hypothetical protein